MTAQPQPQRRFAIYTDPIRERKLAYKFLFGAVVGLSFSLLILLGLVVGEFKVRYLVMLLVFLVLGAGAALLAFNSWSLSRQTGEDLLTLAVDDAGLVAPDQLHVPWAEISEVILIRHAERKKAKHQPHSIDILVRSSDALLARATKQQGYAIERLPSGLGKVSTGFGAVTEQQMQELRQVLHHELPRRGIPFHERAD